MAKQVRETTAGSAISAYIVLNKKGEHVATVNVHYANSGRVSVDVFNIGDKAIMRCYDAAMSTLQQPARGAAMAKANRDALAKHDWRRADDATNWAAYDLFGMQQSHAGGYGYDKRTAALAGLWIDGQQLADHCGRVGNAEKAHAALFRKYNKAMDGGLMAQGDRAYWDTCAQKIGARFTNWSSEKNRYTSLYFQPGLERLETLGYRVIQAI